MSTLTRIAIMKADLTRRTRRDARFLVVGTFSINRLLMDTEVLDLVRIALPQGVAAPFVAGVDDVEKVLGLAIVYDRANPGRLEVLTDAVTEMSR